MPSEPFGIIAKAISIDYCVPRKEKRKFDRSKICVKCKTNSGYLVIRHSVYCR